MLTLLTTWKEIVYEDLRSMQLNSEGALIHHAWRSLTIGNQINTGE